MATWARALTTNDTEFIEDTVGAMLTGNTETNITVTYQDGDGTIDFVSTDTNTTYSVQDGELSQNSFTDADHSKLDGIEASADVTDATNVNAAGALMLSDTSTSGLGIVVDEDDFASDSATKVPTQQSVKAYIATQVSVGDITSVVAGTGLSGGATSGDATLNLDLAELPDMTSAVSGSADELILLDNGNSGQKKQLNEIALSAFSNDSGWTSNTGDITGVTIETDSGSGSKASDASGSADFKILGTTGVGVTNSGATITVTSVAGEIDHDSLSNFVANEHLDWTSSVGTIHSGNYTNTTYSVGDGGLTTNDFTDADHTKLNAIEASADVTDLTNVSAALASLTGSDTLSIGDAGNDATVNVRGNLTVTGTTTTVNTETINLADNIIVLNSNETGTPSENAGIEVERGTSANVSIYWEEAKDSWFASDGSVSAEIGVVERVTASPDTNDAGYGAGSFQFNTSTGDLWFRTA
jgi:hypothetical protein|tara:strand:- start:958 stop:2370 length:1413 start_codon:yes stop_codon:yes gene_type:complete